MSKDKPEDVRAGAADSNLQKAASDWMTSFKSVISFVVASGTLIYAVGFLCHFFHHKMLGICQVEYSTDKIVFNGVSFFLLVFTCIPFTVLRQWRSWYLIALLLLWYFAGLSMRRRDEVAGATGRSEVSKSPVARFMKGKLAGVNVTKIVHTACIVLFHIVSFFLAVMILTQGGVLFEEHTKPPGYALRWFGTITSFHPELRLLLADNSRYLVAGFFYIASLPCLLHWLLKVCRLFKVFVKSKSIGENVFLKRCSVIASTIVLVAVFMLQTMMYGFLLTSNKYPVVMKRESESSILPEEELFVFGKFAGRTLVYCNNHQQLWWISESELLPVYRTGPPRDLFEDGETKKLGE